jgi:tripeptidyl-peptidase I
MIARVTTLFLAGAALAWASPYQLKEFHPIPRGWTQLGRAPASHSIRLEIGLKQSRFDELEKSLYEGMPAVNL